MHICQKYMKFSSFTHFCRESKSVAIYALCPESFCVKNLAIRKDFAFSDSAEMLVSHKLQPQGWSAAFEPDFGDQNWGIKFGLTNSGGSYKLQS